MQLGGIDNHPFCRCVCMKAQTDCLYTARKVEQHFDGVIIHSTSQNTYQL